MLSSYHLIILSSYHLIILSSYHLIILSSYHLIILSSYAQSGKEECKVWQARGEMDGLSKTRGYLTAALVMCILLYGLTTACLLLDSKTSCLAAVGGTGC
jgi:hypothetical protein